MAEIHILFSLVVLIGSSLKGFTSTNNRPFDFVATFTPAMTTDIARTRPQSTRSLPSTTTKLSKAGDENAEPAVLDLPQAPYARKALAVSHETWPRWSVDEGEDEGVVTPRFSIAHDENDDREEIPIQVLPPPPVWRRDDHSLYVGQARGDFVGGSWV